ncbi:MAG: BMP family ABC transporter substrate-binding protein [Lachnospiraceae bacterium]|nr:BMP family ABC transporter substrate-binding protein [Lachnospiraceae bacterium]
MKKAYIVTFLTAVLAVVMFYFIAAEVRDTDTGRTVKIGVVYVGDVSDAYTHNFVKAVNSIENTYGDKVEILPKYNIAEGKEEAVISELVDSGCDIIFGTSFGYASSMKKIAMAHPDIEFCMATATNAGEEPFLDNYHTFMGEIYEGRYAAGVVAGMKIKELINKGVISGKDVKVGYVAAFPYAEVISGYTAFFMGVRSEVEDAVMYVKYTSSWSDYVLEKKYADELIDEGCILISQHSDTAGPAVACEERDVSTLVYHVGYNISMLDVAPTTSLVSSRINWEPYMVSAVGAVIEGRSIEECVKGNRYGNDVGAGFERDWVQLTSINENIAAPGTSARVAEIIDGFKDGSINVFKGDYTGTDPFDPTDTIDLKGGYTENSNSSAPTFHYVLDDCIIVEE